MKHAEITEKIIFKLILYVSGPKRIKIVDVNGLFSFIPEVKDALPVSLCESHAPF